MDMSAFFEQTAKQISKIFLPGSDINTPVVTMLFWTRSTPRVTRPSPLKKKPHRTSGGQKWNYAPRAKLHGIYSPPPTGLTLPVWNTEVRLV